MDILKQPVLVLNRLMFPISTITVQEALKMLFGGEFTDERGKPIPKAKAIDHETWYHYDWDEWAELPLKEGEPVIHGGCGQKFRVPEIIISTRFHSIPKNQLNCTRHNIFRRDEFKCLYCGKHPADSIDHIHPKSKGGKFSWTNCVVACYDCNQKKKDKTLAESGMKLLRQPYRPGLEILGQHKMRLKSWEPFFKKG